MSAGSRPRAATILDVAKAAGVSRQTVVRALRDQPRISAETRERVLRAAARLHYQPNRAAQALVGAPTRMLSLVLGDLRNPFYAELAESLRSAAERRDHIVMLMRRPPAEELDRLGRRLAGYGVDGVVIFPHVLPRARVATLADAVRRVVVVGAAERHPRCSQIRLDDRAAVALAVEHLEACDRHRVGVVGYLGREGHEHPRLKLLRQRFDGAFAIAETMSERAGYEAGLELLAADPRLDALVAFSDALGLGAMRAAHDRGRRIPDDVAVVAFDGTDAARFAGMSLTSIGYGIERIADNVVSMLVEGSAPRRVTLSPALHAGESTSP